MFRFGSRRELSKGFSESESQTRTTSSINSTPNPGCLDSYHSAASAMSNSISGRNSTRHFIVTAVSALLPSLILEARPTSDSGGGQPNGFPPRIGLRSKDPVHPIRASASSTFAVPPRQLRQLCQRFRETHTRNLSHPGLAAKVVLSVLAGTRPVHSRLFCNKLKSNNLRRSLKSLADSADLLISPYWVFTRITP
jgi:hypothetical protein